MTAETVSASANVVLALCGVGTVLAAWAGLGTWRRQLTGNLAADTARRMLLATYRLRDAIQWVRNPFMSSGEQVEAVVAAGIPEPDRQAFYADKHRRHNLIYQRRWDKVVAAKTELDVVYVECEVLWGNILREPMLAAKASMLSVLEGVEEHLVALSRPDHNYLTPAEIRARIYAMGENDEIVKSIKIWVYAIESVMRQHLRT